MDRNTKELLHQYYEAPSPTAKRQFVREHRVDRMSITQVVRTQLHYISKKSWIISFALFVLMVVHHDMLLNTVWMGSVYALVPFLVMISFTECMRSYQYGMEELELATRFSLKSIVLARLLILGGSNTFALLIVAVVTSNDFWVQMVYLMVPFLITSWCGFIIMRRFAGKDGNYYCFGTSAVISVLQFAIFNYYRFIYDLRYFWEWVLIGLLFAFLLVREGVRTIRMTEELAWN